MGRLIMVAAIFLAGCVERQDVSVVKGDKVIVMSGYYNDCYGGVTAVGQGKVVVDLMCGSDAVGNTILDESDVRLIARL